MKQSEIWLIDLDPTVGAEIKKTRPVVVINDDAVGKLPLKIIVPLTDWKEHYALTVWMIKVDLDKYNNLTKTSAADCFQIRSVSQDRFIKKPGSINQVQLTLIQDALASVLSIQSK
ncbi:type II toxin-antitoxin system PemK/MazF family toxin [Mucilaginibacter sp.]|uniref:type II toxin-antitoxin system PemK/MazF family toxin n=1 Tax=Mucilaginibacter sp. TaxID=1882438 RepID=UPI00284F3F38|nr:type II toxin-antitoxin system PemK/MazF family toxin [Mucilaginibacter sp.]MDR3694336.1 type II toxin-antitoxin system PemK/MazF family toxin [Mucilaginibacter sp.]